LGESGVLLTQKELLLFQDPDLVLQELERKEVLLEDIIAFVGIVQQQLGSHLLRQLGRDQCVIIGTWIAQEAIVRFLKVAAYLAGSLLFGSIARLQCIGRP